MFSDSDYMHNPTGTEGFICVKLCEAANIAQFTQCLDHKHLRRFSPWSITGQRTYGNGTFSVELSLNMCFFLLLLLTVISKQC